MTLERKKGMYSGIKMIMFACVVILILYLRQMTCKKFNVNSEDLHLVYTLYTCILLLLCGCSLPSA